MSYQGDEGLDPRTAGALIAVVALGGVAFFVLAASLDRKSGDPLYDPINPEFHTSSQVQLTPDLWKRKGEGADAAAGADDGPPGAQPPAVPTPPAQPTIPIKIHREMPPADQPKTPPTTSPG